MTFINENNLKIGDILLGYTSSAIDKGHDELNTGYVHASIYFGENEVAEAIKPNVQITTFEKSIEVYDHIAVLRQPDAWHAKNISKFKSFVQDLIINKAKFNRQGIKAFKTNLKAKYRSEQENLKNYFDGKYQPKSPFKEEYFCSEFVVSVYIAIGFISESAAIIYNPEVMSPSSLGNDPTFGTFLGYIKSYEEYIIPQNDQFMNRTTYYEIYG
ncbi:hypothetical protein ACN2C1_07855 [Aliarcobacter butzleri]|uniref:hypothetical protein n=1 Tax=Aliarcobacter butzleri TaxID=28197 RepID=UPI003AFA5ECA